VVVIGLVLFIELLASAGLLVIVNFAFEKGLLGHEFNLRSISRQIQCLESFDF